MASPMGISKKTAENYYKNFQSLTVKIPWKFYVYVLKHYYNFEISSAGRTSGSKRLFNNGEVRFTAKEPHDREPIVDRTSRENAIAAIKRLEALREKKGE